MVRALERRGIAQARFSRAFEDAIALRRTALLHAADTLVHG